MRSAQEKVTTKSKATKPATGKSIHRLLLVDDHPMMRMGWQALISNQPDLRVADQASSCQEALLRLGEQVFDLVVTDLALPDRGGLELIKDMRELHPETPVLVISMHDEMLYAERALRAGARGYLMKEAGGERMLTAIRDVLGGRVHVSERMSAKILEGMTGSKPRGSSSPVEKLSDREFEVFQLIGQGRGTRQIAEQLSLSPKTVEVHRAHIKEKLALESATDLVRHAVRWVESNQT